MYYAYCILQTGALTVSTPKPLKPAHQLILILLAEEPSYGVELLERIEQRSGGAIRMNAGSLYRTIASLVDSGLVLRTEDDAPRAVAGAPRKTYEVTRAGLDALRHEAHRQESLLDAVKALDLLGESP